MPDEVTPSDCTNDNLCGKCQECQLLKDIFPESSLDYYCKYHREGGIQSSTVSGNPCVVCGAAITKTGRPNAAALAYHSLQ